MNSNVLYELKRLLRNFDGLMAEACDYGENMADLVDYEEIRRDVLAKYSHTHINKPKTVHFFGSRTFGLAAKNSDLDIFVDMGNIYFNLLSHTEAANLVDRSSNWYNNDPAWTLICRIKKATVPILRVKLVKNGLVCDISFSNGFACENSKYLGYLFSLQPEASKMAHFLKLWFGSSGLKMKGNLLVNMLVFYLQSCKFMPSTKEAQHNCDAKIIGKSNVAFEASRELNDYHKLLPMGKYKNYIPGFMKFYIEFPFEDEIASVYMGASIKKIDYGKMTNLALYPGCSYLDPLHKNLSVIVLGPFDLSVNLASFGKTKLRKMRNFCKHSLPLLKDI